MADDFFQMVQCTLQPSFLFPLAFQDSLPAPPSQFWLLGTNGLNISWLASCIWGRFCLLFDKMAHWMPVHCYSIQPGTYLLYKIVTLWRLYSWERIRSRIVWLSLLCCFSLRSKFLVSLEPPPSPPFPGIGITGDPVLECQDYASVQIHSSNCTLRGPPHPPSKKTKKLQRHSV